jgi:hypothetical protein
MERNAARDFERNSFLAYFYFARHAPINAC